MCVCVCVCVCVVWGGEREKEGGGGEGGGEGGEGGRRHTDRETVGAYVEGGVDSLKLASHITSDQNASLPKIVVHLMSILLPNLKDPNLVTI